MTGALKPDPPQSAVRHHRRATNGHARLCSPSILDNPAIVLAVLHVQHTVVLVTARPTSPRRLPPALSRATRRNPSHSLAVFSNSLKQLSATAQ